MVVTPTGEVPRAQEEAGTGCSQPWGLGCLTGLSWVHRASFPALVVKASGLAAGKGVIVAANQDEACAAVMDIMKVLECFEML